MPNIGMIGKQIFMTLKMIETKTPNEYCEHRYIRVHSNTWQIAATCDGKREIGIKSVILHLGHFRVPWNILFEFEASGN